MSCNFETFLSTGATLELFGRFMVIGFALGVVYNAARLLRLSAGAGKGVTAIIDFLFIMLFGLVVFIFSVAFGVGDLRFYYIIAAFFGFLLNMVTLGNVVGFLSRQLNRLLRHVSAFLKRRIIAPIRCKFRDFTTKLSHVFVEICQKMSNRLEKPKNYLKNILHIVYNKHNNTTIGVLPQKGGENRNAIQARVTKIL